MSEPKWTLGPSLEKYLGVAALKDFINLEIVLEKMVAFRLPTREVKRKPQELCLGCGLPTGKGPRARRCEPCRKKHRNAGKFKPTLVRRKKAA